MQKQSCSSKTSNPPQTPPANCIIIPHTPTPQMTQSVPCCSSPRPTSPDHPCCAFSGRRRGLASGNPLIGVRNDNLHGTGWKYESGAGAGARLLPLLLLLRGRRVGGRRSSAWSSPSFPNRGWTGEVVWIAQRELVGREVVVGIPRHSNHYSVPDLLLCAGLRCGIVVAVVAVVPLHLVHMAPSTWFGLGDLVSVEPLTCLGMGEV